MSQDQSTSRGAVAGSILIGSITLFALLGAVIGYLVDTLALPTIAGGFIGLLVGFRVVYVRFKDL